MELKIHILFILKQKAFIKATLKFQEFTNFDQYINVNGTYNTHFVY